MIDFKMKYTEMLNESSSDDKIVSKFKKDYIKLSEDTYDFFKLVSKNRKKLKEAGVDILDEDLDRLEEVYSTIANLWPY